MSRPCQYKSKVALDQRVIIQLTSLATFGNGFPMHTFGTVSPTQISAGNIKIRVKRESAVELSDRFIVAAGKKERPANICAYRQRKRIKLFGTSLGNKGFIKPPPQRKILCTEPIVDGGVIRIKFDGAAKFLFRADPIPFIIVKIPSERAVWFGQRIVNFQRP